MGVNRGDVYLVSLDPTLGSEIKKTRPCLVISPNEMNRHIKTVIVAPMTTKGRAYPYRAHPLVMPGVALLVPLTRAGHCDYIVITQRRRCDMRARLVRIGNSRGVRLPKPLIEEAGLSDEVELRVRAGTIVIAAARQPRAGWAAAALEMRRRNADLLLDPPTATRFDEEEWQW
jgi:antitoxin MazE